MDLTILTATFAGQPAWLWAAFISGVGVLLWVDLGLINRKDGVVSAGRSAAMWAGFAAIAIAFGAFVYYVYEPPAEYYVGSGDRNLQATLQYFTGYLLETALAFDNIFVMSLIFAHLAVPREYQHRVLFWGIIGAIMFRAIFIGVGAAIVTQFTFVLYIFALFLIYTGWKMLAAGEEEAADISENRILKFLRKRIRLTDTIGSHNFFVRAPNKKGKPVLHATPLLLALLMVEIVDIIFAVDSVPAIFAVTRDPFIVYTSNIFAILGLRSLYFMLAAAVERFSYLKYGLAAVLVLIGLKIFWNFGLAEALHVVPHLEAHWSLLATVTLLGGSMLVSLWKTRERKPAS